MVSFITNQRRTEASYLKSVRTGPLPKSGRTTPEIRCQEAQPQGEAVGESGLGLSNGWDWLARAGGRIGDGVEQRVKLFGGFVTRGEEERYSS
jgi:hypothetical protein